MRLTSIIQESIIRTLRRLEIFLDRAFRALFKLLWDLFAKCAATAFVNVWVAFFILCFVDLFSRIFDFTPASYSDIYLFTLFPVMLYTFLVIFEEEDE